MSVMPDYPYAIFPDPDNLPSLPSELLAEGQNFYDRLAQRAAPDDMEIFAQQKDLLYVLALSDFIAKTLIQYPHACAQLLREGALESPYYSLDLGKQIEHSLQPNMSEPELKKALRILRRVHMMTIAWRDLTGRADIEEVFVSLSNLAEGIVCRTIDLVRDAMTAAYGQAYDAQGKVMPLLILGMGKLGGGELNFSSDIDLICCYPYDGQTQGGARSITFQEYFTKVVQRFSNLLAEITADSFCYRIDLRLRPFGDSGPLVSSFDALAVYYETQGRTWERYALVKAKLLGDHHIWGAYGDELIEMLRPFVYRRYLDYGAIESLRKLKHMIEAEVRRRNLGDNFKLGEGGIREIEFIAQVFELMRGGRMSELVERSLRKTLRNISHLQLLPKPVCQNLDECYVYLRRLENITQMLADKQTQTLPNSEKDRMRVALGMNKASFADLMTELEQIRAKVHHEFVAVMRDDASAQDEMSTENIELWESSYSVEELASLLVPLLMGPAASAAANTAANAAATNAVTTAPAGANGATTATTYTISTSTATITASAARSTMVTTPTGGSTASTPSSSIANNANPPAQGSGWRRARGNSMAARMVASGRNAYFGSGTLSGLKSRAAAQAKADAARNSAVLGANAGVVAGQGAIATTGNMATTGAMGAMGAMGATGAGAVAHSGGESNAANAANVANAALAHSATGAAAQATAASVQAEAMTAIAAPAPQAVQDEALHLAQEIKQLHSTLTRLPVGPIGRDTLLRLVPKFIRAVTKYKNAAALFKKVSLLLEKVALRTTYLQLLLENKGTREKLLTLLDGNNFAGALISAHPILLDELIAPRYFKTPPHPEEYLAWLNERLLRIDPDDLEEQMEELRLFKKTMVLRIAMSDQSQSLPLMKISDSLTWLAEAILREISMLSWRQTVQKYGAPRDRNFFDPGFAIIAYGKLGGIELGYKSDLDMVFISEVSEEQTSGVDNGSGQLTNSVPVSMFYQRFVQRFMHLCTTRMSGGVLYDLDMRLRPDGDSGVLMTDLTAYDNYQKTRAWTWEHQALVRARAVAGSPRVIESFNKIRDEVLRTPRDEQRLSDDVYAMRMKMRIYLDRSSDKLFDLKQGLGGMVDIEFIAQYLLLREAPRHPDMVLWSDNVRIFDECARLGILSEDTTATLKNAYLAIRECYHRVSLADLPRIVSLKDRPQACDDVVVIFNQIFHDAAERFVPPTYPKNNSLPSVTL